MYRRSRIAVVVPAYREQTLIRKTLAGLPSWVDVVVVVDDASPDDTSAAVRTVSDPRVTLIQHAENRGVGAAITTGYHVGLAQGADVLVVMAGDNQMDPADLEGVVEPVAAGRADYVKGNRFEHPEWRNMPTLRRWAGRALALATNMVSGLRIHDSQCGYTALSSAAARTVALDELWPRYGYPNDLLVLISQAGLRVVEVPVRPVYANERSGVHLGHAVLILGLLARRALKPRPRLADGSHLHPGDLSP